MQYISLDAKEVQYTNWYHLGNEHVCHCVSEKVRQYTRAHVQIFFYVPKKEREEEKKANNQ